MKKKTKVITIAFGLVFVCILAYFCWPITFQFNKKDLVITVDKDINSKRYSYNFNEQETNDFMKILEKSMFYRGISLPQSFSGEKYIRVSGGDYTGFFIGIYQDEHKTLVYAQLHGANAPSGNCRISNADEIRLYIEKIIENRKSEFKSLV